MVDLYRYPVWLQCELAVKCGEFYTNSTTCISRTCPCSAVVDRGAGAGATAAAAARQDTTECNGRR